MSTPKSALYSALSSGTLADVQRLLAEHPSLLGAHIMGGKTWLHQAACEGNVEMVALLVGAGLNVNVPRRDEPGRPLHDAAVRGGLDVARWLIEHGADVDGNVRDGATPLISAAIQGDLAMVKFLVEQGATLDIVFGDPPSNAVSAAEMHGHTDVAAFLRQAGAPGRNVLAAASDADEIQEHVERHLGPVEPLAVTEIVGDLQIFAVRNSGGQGYTTLVTRGMSDRPLAVPDGDDEYRHAELVMHLPSAWPLSEEDLQDSDNMWPIEWLRRTAHLALEQTKWAGGAATVVANGDPSRPLGPNVPFTSLLLLAEASDFGCLHMRDGKLVTFYTVMPIYAEEAALERKKGAIALLQRFQESGVGIGVDVGRANVAR